MIKDMINYFREIPKSLPIRDLDKKDMVIEKLKYSDITEKIIGACFEVYTFLGNGYQKVIYWFSDLIF
ncbi:hypothetical protein VB713_19260 [Anabaena cylindrica UHCC 0172]|nr:hypothetical protein [Anabaena cylindrica UHCC 0172]